MPQYPARDTHTARIRPDRPPGRATLIALLGAAAVQLLIGVHRAVTRTDGTLGATRELRHGASVLSAELRGLRPRDLIAWSDTMMEFDATVGIGITCAIGADRASMTVVAADPAADADAQSAGADALAAMWNLPPQPGDRALVWLAGATPLDSLRGVEMTVRAVSPAVDCEQSPLAPSPSSGAESLAFAERIPGTPAVGAPLRMVRRTRYSLYRAGDGDWYLGRRTLGPSGWDVVQPVAGPLLAARQLGMVVTVRDSSGTTVSDAIAGVAASVRIALRAPRKAGRAAPHSVGVDSVRIDLALRGERGGDT